MRKLFVTVVIILAMASNSFAIVDWRRGLNTDGVLGTDNASDIDYDITNYIQNPLNRLLSDYIYGCTLTYTSATVVTIGIGEVVCSNGAGTIRRMRKNTATTTVDMAVVGVGGIDSGSAEVVSTWYDVYAVADADATTFTAICAQQGNALSDVTYYRYIGSFYNNAASDIGSFFWSGKGKYVEFQHDPSISITTTKSSAAWSAALSLEEAMPSRSTSAVFGVLVFRQGGGQHANCEIRPNGGTGAAAGYSTGAGLATYDNAPGTALISGELSSITSSDQKIQYYNDDSTIIGFDLRVKKFFISR